MSQKFPLSAVVLDWAGTVVDHGCIGPVAVFVEVFRRHGVAVTVAQARKPMGLMKKDHVRSMTQDPEVAAAWRAVHGKDPDENDVDAMYLLTEPLMVECIAQHSTLIPGALDAVNALRRMGLKIGSTTGYTRPMMDILTVEAAKQGYKPDSMVCSSDTPAGRPTPFMVYQTALNLELFPLWRMVKIGDTETDIAEGLNAGMWTIGLTRCGNELGLTVEEAAALPPAQLDAMAAEVGKRFTALGAHYTAHDLASCLPLVEIIAQRVAAGERPPLAE